MLKSIGIVLGSYVLCVVLVLLSDPLLSKIFPDFVRGHVPSDKALAASTALFVLASIFCAWFCAHFAPGSAGRHVLWFFIVGEVMGIVATIPNWNKGMPHWYSLAWLFSWPVSCWIGLLLAGRKENRPATAG
jgi:MFS family permease